MSKQRLTAEEKLEVQTHMKSIMQMDASGREQFIAETVSYAYDEELPIANPLAKIALFKRAGNRPEDNHMYYIKPFGVDKEVFILDEDCNVVHKKVTPGVRQELPFAEVTSPDFWVCLKDFLSGDYDALAVYADAANEMVDRYEIKFVLDLLDAAATANGNVFTLDSDKESLDFPKLVELMRKVALYGTNLKFIAGANVYTDTILMDYLANTFRKYGAEELNIEIIPIESQSIDIDDSGAEVVLDPNTAYLVAVSDREQNKPVLVARRKLNIVGDMSDTTVIAQDRIVIDTGNHKNVSGTNKYARGKAIYEQFGAVVIQGKNVVKFTL